MTETTTFMLASDSLPRGQIVSIADLRRAVFAANANKQSGRDYTDLDVYPPGSTGWTDRSAAADPEDEIERLLPEPDITDRHKRRFVVIVRPLPSVGAAAVGQSSHSHTAHCIPRAAAHCRPLTLRAATEVHVEC